jgi:predicted nucleotidyltransferase
MAGGWCRDRIDLSTRFIALRRGKINPLYRAKSAARSTSIAALGEIRMSVASEQVPAFLSEFSRWAASEPDILAVALVGSHARNEATDGSDVDLVIVARDPKSYLENTRWAQRFGTIDRQQIEQYGKVTSLRRLVFGQS